jgi:beta-lactamase class A
MDIMRRPVTNTLLPRGIAEDARIIHKTGDIGSAVGDAGIVDMPNGQRYAIAVMVTRPHNDQRANELIRQISRTTYDYFSSGGKLSETNAPEQSSPDAASPSDSGTSTIENIVIPLPNTPQPNREQNTDP